MQEQQQQQQQPDKCDEEMHKTCEPDTDFKQILFSSNSRAWLCSSDTQTANNLLTGTSVRLHWVSLFIFKNKMNIKHCITPRASPYMTPMISECIFEETLSQVSGSKNRQHKSFSIYLISVRKNKCYSPHDPLYLSPYQSTDWHLSSGQ